MIYIYIHYFNSIYSVPYNFPFCINILIASLILFSVIGVENSPLKVVLNN